MVSRLLLVFPFIYNIFLIDILPLFVILPTLALKELQLFVYLLHLEFRNLEIWDLIALDIMKLCQPYFLVTFHAPEIDLNFYNNDHCFHWSIK